MKKKSGEKKPIGFSEAIYLALHTPHLTRKEIDKLRKQQKQQMKENNSG